MKRTLTGRHPWKGLVLLGTIAAISLASSLAGTHESVSAQAGVTFGIQPLPGGPGATGKGGYFRYELAPGATTTDRAIVTNEGAAGITLKVYAADAITASGGGTAFGNAGESPTGALNWVTTDATQVTVGPGKQEVVNLKVTVPAGATPGDHVAGIVVEAAPKAGAGGNINTQVIERAGVAIVVRVPGPTTERLALGEFCFNQETGSRYFEISVLNQGSVLTSGSGRFRFETEMGQAVFERGVELGNVIPTLDTVIRVHSPQDPPPGKYVARMTLRQPGGVEVERHTNLTIPEEKVNGCARQAGVAGGRDDGTDDNFAVRAAGEIGGGGSWLVATLFSLTAILTWLLIAVLWRGRRRARKDEPNS